MTYLYEEPDQVVFMDAESYEQLALPKSVLEGRLDLMTLNMQVEVVYIDDEPFDVELPTFVDLKIIDTAAGVRGDTVSGGSKAATLESGAIIQVPLFIEPGDVIRVDTRTREYVDEGVRRAGSVTQYLIATSVLETIVRGSLENDERLRVHTPLPLVRTHPVEIAVDGEQCRVVGPPRRPHGRASSVAGLQRPSDHRRGPRVHDRTEGGGRRRLFQRRIPRPASSPLRMPTGRRSARRQAVFVLYQQDLLELTPEEALARAGGPEVDEYTAQLVRRRGRAPRRDRCDARRSTSRAGACSGWACSSGPYCGWRPMSSCGNRKCLLPSS